jgi:hypothetical protein
VSDIVVTESSTDIVIVQDLTASIVEVLSVGPQGAPGAAFASYPAAVSLSGHIAVVLNASGQALPADAATPSHYAVAGITIGASSSGASVGLLSSGVLEHTGWTFTTDLPVFLGLAGAITQTLPPAAVFSKVLGVAVSPTRISIDFQPAIFK